MLPGFQSPAAGFEAPFEMLTACHERVERTLSLLERLQRHVLEHGCDAQARQAIADVLRYFDMAAPLHHQDEELHVFPALLAGTDTDAADVARQLIAQHRQMERLWATMRVVLADLLACEVSPPESCSGLQPELVDTFCLAYRAHIRLEEDTAYPAARTLLAAGQLNIMGDDMRQRRGAAKP